MAKKLADLSQSELYKMIKAAGSFVTAHSTAKTERFNKFYAELKKSKAAVKLFPQGNDFDILIWWKGRWNSFNEMVKDALN